MVVLLVVATFVALITIDVLLHRDKYKFRVSEPKRPRVQNSAVPVVAGVALPDTLAYHPGHTWVLDQGNGRLRIGLDEFASSLLGSVSKIDVPQRGRWLRQGEKGWTVQTSHGEALMLAPAEGEIVAINEQAVQDPASIARDPYGAGWLVEIFSPDTQVSLRNLLTAGFARRWMEESIAELRAALSPASMATALDGGRIASELGTGLPAEKWSEVTKRFFRS